MPNNSFLKIGSITGERASGTLSPNSIWGDILDYPLGGGHCIADGGNNGCRWEVDISDRTKINYGAIFSPVTLCFFSNDIRTPAMTIDKDTGDVHITGSLYVNGAKIA